jgi:hypothetical protein
MAVSGGAGGAVQTQGAGVVEVAAHAAVAADLLAACLHEEVLGCR